MSLIFATHNQNKLAEIQALLPQHNVISLQDLNYSVEIPETGSTLQENTLIKARTIYKHFKQAVFADDTGLEVVALNGAPGVYSARYAGEPVSAENNMRKLLKAMQNCDNRAARFRTAVAYIDAHGREFLFEGKVEGVILSEKTGAQGFGYDPIFQPLGHSKSFAEMPASLKNKISHRAIAIQKLIQHLRHQKS